ncbi:MAG: 5-formyltetrahydrofolate cyclo-ligase [Candidatus Omnitrophica bacterium]|nr:5-formyltetrahydrofolate cyclo-ligase [Candidatus Omnitrophota bacterium]
MDKKVEEKSVLRKNLLKKIYSLTNEEIERRSKNVEKTIINLPIYKRSKVIMVYYPLKGEVNLLGMVRKALKEKKTICFPVIDLKNKELLPYRVRNLDKDFVKGPLNIIQPDNRHTDKIELDELDLVILPALAMDYNKYRLGRGGGFYDRFINRLQSHTKKIGVVFDFQIFNVLPVCIPYDKKVDIVVSDTVCF